MAATVAGSAWWAAQLLGRTPAFAAGLGAAIVVAGILGAAGLLLPAGRRPGLMGRAAGGLAAFALLGGPMAYSISSAQQSYSGGDPAAGPAVARLAGPGGFAARDPLPPAHLVRRPARLDPRLASSPGRAERRQASAPTPTHGRVAAPPTWPW